MGRIYLVRHAATQWNLDHRWQGVHDIPLSEIGRKQLPGVERFFGGIALDRIYVSDLGRARETAAAVAAATGVEVEVRESLRERAFGRWEGHTNDELMGLYPDDMAAYRADRDGFCPPGGQSWNEFARNAAATLNEVSERHIGDAIAIVSHGGFVRACINDILGTDRGPSNRYNLDNASVSLVTRLDPGNAAGLGSGEAARWRLEALNMTYHLDGDGSA